MRLALFLLAAVTLSAADKLTFPQLLDLTRKAPSPTQLHDALLATFGQEELRRGNVYLSSGPDFVFAIETPRRPSILIDDRKYEMRQAGSVYYWTGQLKTGTSHKFIYDIEGEKFGGLTDVPAYLPESYEQPGVPKGTLSEKLVHTSKIYPGMKSDYWIYVPAAYDPKQPAALMVWQDGQGHIDRNGGAHTLNVIDNLIHQKRIPVMIQVFISPGKIGDKPMRSIEYDTMNDAYARFLRDELLPEVYARYNIRRDGYSRAIAGNSSGGICSFNVAWWQPEQFNGVLSRIGSFTSIQWRPGELDGGNVFPFKVRREPKRNIRVWLQDGSDDLENYFGSWPLQNIQLANSLKMIGYDFHLSFGIGTHNGAHGNAEAPVALTWLWRGYDPGKTEQIYQMEPEERAKPFYRVHIYNRE